ncbi:unnamed protein product [Adineta ricciae]|uniref:Uncharacterized protein n=1 Tax=Adineta ricciae TaxID=249248 RepID=A0A815KA24_ADIRI|nr:unnamed protein product [Adineta ricciae]
MDATHANETKNWDIEMQHACPGISSSQKSRHGRHRHSRQITYEQDALRRQSQQQELEIIRLQSFIQKFRDFTKKLDDEVETMVHGTCRVQASLEDIDCKRRVEKLPHEQREHI